MACKRSRAECSFGRPTSAVPCRICRCRLLKSTTSKSTRPMPADAGRGQVQAQRRTEPAGADQQHAGGLEPLLPVHADFGHDQVPAVAGDFVG